MKILIIFLIALTTSFAHKYQNKIVGGQKATLNQFPYQVSLENSSFSKPYEHLCGGAILNENYVLTAAHCITNDKFRIRAGILHRTDSYKIGQTIEVEDILIHPNYNDENGTVTSHDVAILKLKSPLKFTESIQPIKLPKENQVFKGKAILSGWGKRNSSINIYSNELMFADLHLITLDECKKDFENSSGYYGPLDENNICTRHEDIFACQGDSGGPLVQNNTIIGVVSFAAYPCDLIGSPTAYCDVSKYVNWINENIKR